jgi:acetyl-CoA carboxylase biotin carboxyl carrier protein
MSFSIDDVMEIIQIVKACKDTELHIDTGDIKLSLYKGDVGGASRGPLDFSGPVCINAVPEVKAASAPVSAPLAVEAPAAVEVPPLRTGKEEFSEEGLVPIKATVTSVFYRRPSPDEPPFVEEGDEVHEESVLCLLEVMKCFRQVMAEVRGRIEKICAESNTMVEQGTTLFLIRPY